MIALLSQVQAGGSTVVEVRVATSADDVEEATADGSIYTISSDLELGDDPGFNEEQSVGLRFVDVEVPAGATIVAAWIEFEVDEASADPTSLTIKAEQTGDATPFTTLTNSLTARTFTSATVTWDNIPAWNTVNEKQQTPDLSALVQTVIGQGGWTSGNAIVFLIEGTGERVAESYDGESANAPLLHVEYTGIVPTATPPLPTPELGQTLEIALIGDFGNDSSAEQGVADLVHGWEPDYIVTVGDNRYDVADLDLAIGKYYCDYLHNVTPGTHCPTGGNAPTTVFYPTVGNHEYSDGNGIVDYLDYFDIPGAGAISSNSSGTELYYDFILGPVHFFSLNSETSEGADSLQAQWLQSQLPASTTPWQVILMHRSTSTSAIRYTRGAHMRWPFEAWGADIVINGDDHFYERLQVGGIPLVINGAGGRSLNNYGTIDAASRVRYNDNHGALRIIASDETLEFAFVSRDGVQRDAFSLPQTVDSCRTVSLRATEDTWLERDDPDTNHQHATTMFFDGSPDRGVLMRWDFSSLPADAILQSAPILTIDYENGTVHSYEVYTMAQPWTADGATWNRYDGVIAWPGGAGGLGDIDSQIGVTAGDNDVRNNVTLDQAAIQAWLDGSTPNNGILIANYNNATDGGSILYHAHLTLSYCGSLPTAVQLNTISAVSQTGWLLSMAVLLLLALALPVLLRRPNPNRSLCGSVDISQMRTIRPIPSSTASPPTATRRPRRRPDLLSRFPHAR